MLLFIYCYAACHYDECHYAECRYAKCPSANLLDATDAPANKIERLSSRRFSYEPKVANEPVA